MTFEYRDDATCDKLVAQPDTDDDRKPVVFLSTTGLNNGVYVPVARIEEVVAGIRDAARTAARQTTGQDDTGAACSLPGFAGCECNHLTGCEHPAPAVGQPAEAHGADRTAVLNEAIEAVLGRVEAYEGMGQDAVDRNRERSAIVGMLRRMAVEDER